MEEQELEDKRMEPSIYVGEFEGARQGTSGDYSKKGEDSHMLKNWAKAILTVLDHL